MCIFSSEYEKYNLLKHKDEKKKSTYNHKRKLKKEATSSRDSSESDSSRRSSKVGSQPTGLKKTDSGRSLNNDADPKQNCANYGGTANVESHCAEALASYRDFQDSVTGRKTEDLSVDSKQLLAFQPCINSYDAPSENFRNNQISVENEKYTNANSYSYYQRSKDDESSSGLGSPSKFVCWRYKARS